MINRGSRWCLSHFMVEGAPASIAGNTITRRLPHCAGRRVTDPSFSQDSWRPPSGPWSSIRGASGARTSPTASSLLASREPALDGAGLDPLRLVPADPEQPRDRAVARLEEESDGEGLEEQGEARVGLRPRHPYLPHAVFGAVDARDRSVDEGEELATVEMPPGPLLGVVMKPAGLAALGTGPPLAALVGELDVDPLAADVEVDAVDGPRRLDPEEVAVELRVLHPADDARNRAMAASSGLVPLKTRKSPRRSSGSTPSAYFAGASRLHARRSSTCD